MVYHKVKNIKGRPYNYLIESLKFKGKTYHVQKYLGSKKMKRTEITEAMEEHWDWFQKEKIRKKASLSAKDYKSSIYSSEQLNQLEAIRLSLREYYRGLHPNEIERLERDFDIIRFASDIPCASSFFRSTSLVSFCRINTILSASCFDAIFSSIFC